MRILFCKISAMKFYKGVIPGKDEAFNGGSFVKEYGEGNEQYNFAPVISEDGPAYCLGFVETKSSSKGKHNELHIENIQGCDLLKDDQEVDDVLVIWCATTMLNETSIVGWYQNATVFRNYQSVDLTMEIYKIITFWLKKKIAFYYQKGNDIITYGMRLFQENVRMGLVNHWYGMRKKRKHNHI